MFQPLRQLPLIDCHQTFGLACAAGSSLMMEDLSIFGRRRRNVSLRMCSSLFRPGNYPNSTLLAQLTDKWTCSGNPIRSAVHKHGRRQIDITARILRIKSNRSATFAPKRPLKLTRITPEASETSGRTVVLIGFDNQQLNETVHVSVPLCSLITGQDDHKPLDIVLNADHEYTLQARGPKIRFSSFASMFVSHSPALADISAPTAQMVGVSQHGNMGSQNLSDTGDRGPASSTGSSDHGWYLDLLPLGTGATASQNSAVLVNLEATYRDAENNVHLLFRKKQFKIELAGTKESTGKRIIYLRIPNLKLPRSLGTLPHRNESRRLPAYFFS
ncbi:hypothetical protein FB451DRAFT_1180800 [Mycena latifolia]|nr:hypothetical protein FB451DRAFT_1180800 [Mycena latifolia]